MTLQRSEVFVSPRWLCSISTFKEYLHWVWAVSTVQHGSGLPWEAPARRDATGAGISQDRQALVSDINRTLWKVAASCNEKMLSVSPASRSNVQGVFPLSLVTFVCVLEHCGVMAGNQWQTCRILPFFFYDIFLQTNEYGAQRVIQPAPRHM